jgi:hypothetical protein
LQIGNGKQANAAIAQSNAATFDRPGLSYDLQFSAQRLARPTPLASSFTAESQKLFPTIQGTKRANVKT